MMNKEISRSPPKHEFPSNFTKSPPLSLDQFDFLSAQNHSKDSLANENDDHIPNQRDRLITATDYLSGKNLPMHSYIFQNMKSQAKKGSFDHQKDAVTYHMNTPSTTTNAKTLNKSSQSKGNARGNASNHLNFLNSKEFAKFALSKVLPKETKKDRFLHLDLSPQHKGSKAGSLEKNSPKAFIKEDLSLQAKLNALQQSKKQKVKLRASNLTSHDFSSLLDQTRHINSLINSPQRRGNVQPYLPSKSTANLRPMSTKNQSSTAKNSWQHTSMDAFKRLESSTNNAKNPNNTSVQEDQKSKERNKGTQSIASILNLRREKKLSPDRTGNMNSWYPASQYHRKVASIGCGAQNSGYSLTGNTSVNHSQNVQMPVSQIASIHEDQKSSIHLTKSSVSPENRDDDSIGKEKNYEEEIAMLKHVSSEHFLGLQHTFDNLLEKYKYDIQNAQESYNLLKQIKQAYEGFIIELLAKFGNLETSKILSPEEADLRSKCEGLSKEKAILEDELKYLRSENQKLYNIITEGREREGASKRSDGREDVSSKRESKGSEDVMEDLIINNKLEEYSAQKVNSDMEALKRLVMSQQNTIHTLKNKETKLMQLLYTIHKQGFDVEKLLREEAKKELEQSYQSTGSASGKQNLESKKEYQQQYQQHQQHQQQHSDREVGSGKMGTYSMMTSGDLSDYMLSDSKDLRAKQTTSDAKTTDSTPYPTGNGGTHNALSSLLKNKLKLDFRGLSNNQKSINVPPIGTNNLEQQPDNAEPLGFHDEFMAKIEEFSLSWRQEAMNQRNIA